MKELDAPDLWGQIQQMGDILSVKLQVERGNDLIAAAEGEKLTEQFRLLEQRIYEEIEAASEHRKEIHKHFESLNAAISQMSGTDWLFMCIGRFIAIVNLLKLTAEGFESFRALVSDILTPVIRLSAPEKAKTILPSSLYNRPFSGIL